MDDDELLTVGEIAARLKLHPETVRRWIRTGRVPAFLAGTDQAGYRVRSSDLATFLTEARQLPLPDTSQKKAAA